MKILLDRVVFLDYTRLLPSGFRKTGARPGAELKALNQQNLGYPNAGYCLSPNADGSTDLDHQAGCSFGRITNIQTDPRSMQFALKFYW
ncbi:MAG: hypothetical protein ABSF71_31005 [Terriglobia bacterium]|jgi:hypothetical protein